MGGNGHEDVSQVLLNARAGVEVVGGPGKVTPLMQASHAGHAQIAQMLLSTRASVEATNPNKSTSLHLASAGGHVEVAKLLLSAHADVKAKDASGTPLDVATLAGQTGELL